MTYSLINPGIEAQIAELKRQIRGSMNGIVSEQMIRNGIIYDKNFGVSTPRIKEIASRYTPNHELAQRLWNLQIRETMILSILLEPVDLYNLQNAQNRVETIHHIEIVEQACMNLFCKLSFSGILCKKWIQSDSILIQITGFVLAARLVEIFIQSEINFIIKQALKISTTNDLHLYKAVGLCLSRFCRKNKETASYILKEITAFSSTTTIGQYYISTEVKQEILFLNTL